MKCAYKLRTLSVIIILLFVLQLLPINIAFAATGDLTDATDLTGTNYLIIHGRDYDAVNGTIGQSSDLTITASGSVLSPDASGAYQNVPAGATISFDYAFSLSDGDGTNVYTYDGTETFTAALPSGINFIQTTEQTFGLGTWQISGSTLTVKLTGDTSGTAMWGTMHIDGTFKALSSGDSTTTSITFGSQTVTINREPLPQISTLKKSGSYDASTNMITWLVEVTPPSTPYDYSGYTLIDTYSGNQTFVTGSFIVGSTSVSDSSLDLTTVGAIKYTFDASTTNSQTITYQTQPNAFGAENGSSAEYSTFTNTVGLKRGEDPAATDVSASLDLDWISKTGQMAATNADASIVKWTVSVAVPGDPTKAISGAVITDTIPSDLELITGDPDHPIALTGTEANIADYSYSSNVLTYTFPSANQPTSGTTAYLTFYTRVTAAAWTSYMNTNSAISFTNTSAVLSWSGYTGSAPSDTYTFSGIGSGGILEKSGSSTNYIYSAADPGTLEWTITVNRNKAVLSAVITDTVRPGQVLIIDAAHPLTVSNGTPTDTITSAASSGHFTYTSANEFTYDLGSISTTYTIHYYTRLTGVSNLYTNNTVQFDNDVKLSGTDTVSLTRHGSFSALMIRKSVKTSYDYTTHTIQWQVVVNRNQLPLTNGVVSDTVPSGMTLLIDATHLFTVTPLNGSDAGTLNAVDGGSTFTLTLPTPTADQFTLTYWTKLSDDTLKTQWAGKKTFTNTAKLNAAEFAGDITSDFSAYIYNPVITKSYVYTPGSDTIDWTVVVNPAHMTLTNAVITDVLSSSLKLDPDIDKLQIYEATASVNSVTGEVTSAISGSALDKSTYTVTVPSTSNGNTLSVTLPPNTSMAYILKFSTIIAADSINLSNTVSISGAAGDITGGGVSSVISVSNLYANSGSGINSITVIKQDAFGNPLSGATYQLYNLNKQPILKSGSSLTATTDATGTATFSGLPSWVFYVKEITPPAGYLIPSDPYQGGTRLSGTETLTFTDALALADVSFQKLGVGGVLLSGGTFTLIGKDYAGNDVTKTAAAVNGTVMFTNVAPNITGSPYAITETTAPTGHELSSTKLYASVAYNTAMNALTVSVTPGTLTDDPAKGTVTFTKTGTGGVLLTGGSFSLAGTDYTGSTVTKTAHAASGAVTFTDVPIGSYSISETDPPDGYLMPSAPEILTATVAYNAAYSGLDTTIKSTESGTPTVSLYANQQAYGTISFQKLDSTDSSPLSGGTFTLTGKDYAGNDVNLSTSSVGGIVTFKDVPIGGSYTIKENTAPNGFLVSSTQLTASVTYNADKTGVVTNISAVSLKDDPAPIAETIYANIYVLKTDVSGNKLADAVFTIYNASGVAVQTAISAANGIAHFDHMIKGSYTVKETTAPAGYDLNPNTIMLTVSTSSDQSFTVVNTKIADKTGTVVVVKTDEDGNTLSGAVFTLTDKDGKVLGSLVTDAHGTAVFNEIPAGSYTMTETTPPTGYIAKTGGVTVNVINGNTASLTFVNKKADKSGDTDPAAEPEQTGCKLQLLKVDTDYHPLKGAEFTLYDRTGASVATAVSGTDGLAVFQALSPGSYSVKETVAPEGYLLFSESLTIQIAPTDTVLSFTLKDTKPDSDQGIAGWSDEKLPQTGGLSVNFLLFLSGISLLLTGLILGRSSRHKSKHTR